MYYLVEVNYKFNTIMVFAFPSISGVLALAYIRRLRHRDNADWIVTHENLEKNLIIF